MYETILAHKDKVLPMDVLTKLSEIHKLGQVGDEKLDETLKVKFMVLIMKEYRKHKEVSIVRDHKKKAMLKLEQLRQQNADI